MGAKGRNNHDMSITFNSGYVQHGGTLENLATAQYLYMRHSTVYHVWI
jgi:hypothetical protein